MDGGLGKDLRDVAEYTLDQVYLLLVDRENLRSGPKTVKMVSSLEVMDLAKDGQIKGRTGEGKPITAKVSGKSLCRRLMEEAEEKAKAEAQAKLELEAQAKALAEEQVKTEINHPQKRRRRGRN